MGSAPSVAFGHEVRSPVVEGDGRGEEAAGGRGVQELAWGRGPFGVLSPRLGWARIRVVRRRIEEPSRGNPALSVGQAVVEAVRAGATRATAAHWAGVDPATLGGWVARGSEEIGRAASAQLEDPDGPAVEYAAGEAPFARLAEELLFAEAAMEMEAILRWQQVMSAGKVLPGTRAPLRDEAGRVVLDEEGRPVLGEEPRTIPDWRAVDRFLAKRRGGVWSDRVPQGPGPSPQQQGEIGPVLPSPDRAQALIDVLAARAADSN